MTPLPARIAPSMSGWEIKPTERMNEDWHPVLFDSEDENEIVPTAAAALMKMVGIW